MPVDIAGAVTPTYDSVINVPLDGEYANSAALQAMVLPIANRVAYLKSNAEDAPWGDVSIFDDFRTPFLIINAQSAISDGGLWTTDSAFGNYTQNVTFGADPNVVGLVNFQNSTGSAVTAPVKKNLNFFRQQNFRRLTARLQLGSIAAGMGFHLSCEGPAVSNIRAAFVPATSANWLLQTNAGTENYDTGVPVAINTYYELDLTHDGASGYALSVNGSAPVSPITTIPPLTNVSTMQWTMISPNAGANRSFLFDYVYARFVAPGRVI